MLSLSGKAQRKGGLPENEVKGEERDWKASESQIEPKHRPRRVRESRPRQVAHQPSSSVP